MELDDLSTDILWQIFALTDVHTILSLARVNRSFHEIAYRKQLWLSVVRGLSLAQIIDAPADETLETLSTEELVGEVRRVVAGPKTWSPASPVPPTLQRKLSLRLDTPVLDWRPPKLLPGGKYVVVFVPGPVHQITGLEYWEVHTGRRVWKWGREDYTVIREVSDLRGATLVVLIIFAGSDVPQTYHAIIVEVDLASGESVELYRLPIDPMLEPDPQLCGDFLIFKVLRQVNALLLNWRTEEGFLFDSEWMVFYALFPEHIVLAYASRLTPPRMSDLRVYAISSFYDLWRPLSDLIVSMDSRTDISHIPFVACSVPTANAFLYRDSMWTTPIVVTRSPLHDATYDCVAKLTVDVPVPPPRPASLLKRLRSKLKLNAAAPSYITSRFTTYVFHYQLTFPPNAEGSASSVLPQFRLKYTWRVPGHALGTTTYAGYSMCYCPGRPRVVQRASDNETKEAAPVRFPGGELPWCVQLTRSGALVEVRQNCVVVSYYQ